MLFLEKKREEIEECEVVCDDSEVKRPVRDIDDMIFGADDGMPSDR